VPVRTVYAGEASGINPLVAVPTILYLIFRSFLRLRLSGWFSESPLSTVSVARSESAD
jgi:hypothetical protein